MLLLQIDFNPLFFFSQRGNYLPRGETGEFGEGEGRGVNCTPTQASWCQPRSKGSQSGVYDWLHHLEPECACPDALPALSFHFFTGDFIQTLLSASGYAGQNIRPQS